MPQNQGILPKTQMQMIHSTIQPLNPLARVLIWKGSLQICHYWLQRADLTQRPERDTQQHFQLAVNIVHQQQVTIREQENTLAHLQSKEMPMKYKFIRYDHHKTANKSINSPDFYTSPEGHKMCINVYANGVGEAEGTHVSVFP